jgi:SIR2-like domain
VEALKLDHTICAAIVAQLEIGSANLRPMLKFAAWIARADYHLPIEIFTLNYDLLTETALERLRTPYFDGFVGTFCGAFRTDLVEATPSDDAWLPPFIARLWKLHGSVSWQWSNNDVIRLGQTVGGSDAAAIFPSDMKYDQSRRVPFVVLHDRLRRALLHPETLTIITGYSWSDEHLNEVIFDAARHRPRSEIVAFSRSTLPDVLVEHAREIPNLQAVTGTEAVLSGVKADWKSGASKPPDDVWADDKLALREFGPLAEFLARSSPPHQELEARLAEVLAAAGGAGA